MAEPLLNSCCRCQTLKTGSIICGIMGILLAIASLIMLFVIRVEFKTIVIDSLPSYVVKIILAINLCMTILISILLIIGTIKVNKCIIITISVHFLCIMIFLYVSLLCYY